jgi:hypothetical protein
MAPLTSLQIHTLSRWIADGALNSVCTDVGCIQRMLPSAELFFLGAEILLRVSFRGSPSGGILLTGFLQSAPGLLMADCPSYQTAAGIRSYASFRSFTKL